MLAEIELARNVVPHAPPLSTVFFGGGTPTLLAPSDQALIVRALREAFGLAEDAEVTTEANPESVSPAQLVALRAAGVNRISFGMQSAVPHVLATLDRTHTPGRVVEAVAEARAAGFDNISRRPHLRNTGGVARRLARLARGRHRTGAASTSAPTR